MIMKKWDKLPDVMKTDEVKPYYLALKRKTASLIIKRVFDIIVSLILLILLSPVCYVFHHRAEIEVLVQKTDDADNDARLDRLLEAVGRLLTVDVTLSGLIDHMHAEPPEFIEQPVEGGLTIKAAIVPVTLEYVSDSNLT